MIQVYLTVFFAVAALVAPSLGAALDVVEARSYADIEKAFDQASGDTLGVFDIDGVLTYSSNPAFQKKNWRENSCFVKSVLRSLTPDQRWLFVNFSLISAKSVPVDPNGWATIKKIQESGAKTIALTASMPGLLGDVYLQEWRYKQLKSLGIDFSNSFPDDPSFCMSELCCYMGRYPAFFNGILFANGELRLGAGGCNKGDVLVEFLRRKNWKPRHVLFVDDNYENLTAVEKALAFFDPGIGYQGVHFHYEIPVERITQEAFQGQWKKILALVSDYEKNFPSCALYTPNVID